jgi:GNAT superfamily N-acetyltransferase
MTEVMPAELVIRAAADVDRDVFLELMRHLKPDDPDIAPDVPTATFLDVIRHPGLTVLGGFIGQQLVASCTLIVIPNFMRAGTPYALIENVVTHSAHRQKGHGQAVVRRAVELGFAAGCYKVMLLTGRTDPGIMKFYASCGFEQTKTGFQVRSDK